MAKYVHVLTGKFEQEAEARDYVFETILDEDADDDEYPTLFETELSFYQEPEFVEVIFGADRFDYLKGLLTESEPLEMVKKASAHDDDTLVLVFSFDDVHEDLDLSEGGLEVEYIGRFPFEFQS